MHTRWLTRLRRCPSVHELPSHAPMPTNDDSHASDSPERRVEQLNWLGQAVYVSGTLHRWAHHAARTVQARTDAVVRRSQKAFYEGLDSNIDEARVLDEHPDEAPVRNPDQRER